MNNTPRDTTENSPRALEFDETLTQILRKNLASNVLFKLPMTICRGVKFVLDQIDFRRTTQYCEAGDFRCTIHWKIAHETSTLEGYLQQNNRTALPRCLNDDAGRDTEPKQTILCRRNGIQRVPLTTPATSGPANRLHSIHQSTPSPTITIDPMISASQPTPKNDAPGKGSTRHTNPKISARTGGHVMELNNE